MKKIILVITMLSLTVCLFVCGFSLSVSAEDSGECGADGANITWSVDELGILKFNGSGNIKSYSSSGSNRAPWLKDHAEKIKTVSFSDGITGVGAYCFYGCKNLTSAVIPSCMEKIGEGAFYGCGSLNKITVGEENTKYKIESGCLIDIEENTVIRGNASASIPETVTKIGSGAFSGCGFESFEVPKTVIYIGQGAFDGCENLKSITLPFVGDCRLDKDGNPAVLPDDGGDGDAQRGLYLNKLGYIFGKTAELPKSLEMVVITDTETIGSEAFSDCSGLKSIVLPESLVNIGEKAFYGCVGLAEIKLPESIKALGDKSFCGCTGLTSVVISDNVTSVGESAFFGCNRLKSVALGKSVNAIGNEAFAGCPALESLKVAEGNVTYYAESDCIIASESLTLVLGCKKSVIPQNIKAIGTGAFRNCIGLVEVQIPDEVTLIGDYAFYSCTGLKSVDIPSSVKAIGEFAFAECLSLKKINLTSDVKVGESAFANCVSLKTDSLYMTADPNEGISLGCAGLWIGLAVAVPLAAFGTLFAILLHKKKKNEKNG